MEFEPENPMLGGLIAGGAIGAYNDAFGSQTLLR